MTKLLAPIRLVLALATVFTVSGCELYFGGHDGNGGGSGSWTYCGNDGYYVCQGDNCEWAGARCPQDPGYSCTSNQDCAAGCFCDANGQCEEAGFCATDQDCPTDYHCDTARNSCVPNPPATCNFEQDCQNGEVCDPATKTCTATCTCTSDADAQAQGYASCNEVRQTCEPTNAAGSCGGTSTCNQLPPACAEGEVPMINNGCYTGVCNTVGTCDVTPTCAAYQHENDCLGDGACTSVYTGINCTNGGAACHAGDSGCTCESFQYSSCTTHTLAQTVVQSSSGFVDMSAALAH